MHETYALMHDMYGLMDGAHVLLKFFIGFVMNMFSKAGIVIL
jgi:hypothetical protein